MAVKFRKRKLIRILTGMVAVLGAGIVAGGCQDVAEEVTERAPQQEDRQIDIDADDVDIDVDDVDTETDTEASISIEDINADTEAETDTEADTEADTDTDTDTDAPLVVTFLDVGQGNAVLVEQDGEYMLIDGGDREYSSYVVSYLKKQGVEELSYVIASHYDADHLNGVVGVLHAFPCEKVLAADYETDTKIYQSFYDVVEEKDIELVYPSAGDTYTFQDAEFTVVCPENYNYADDNDNSVGIRLVHGENSFLFCGDAGEKSEKAMEESGLTLSSDVYLASHHGSAGSSKYSFLEKVKPQAVVVSAGRGNSYGHPAESVLSHVKELGAELYRTDIQGEIRVVSDGKNLQWNTDACEDYRSGDEVKNNENGKDERRDEAENESVGYAGDAESGKEAETDGAEQTYVLNQNTKKFHRPGCGSVSSIKEENRADFTGSREELIDAGYSPCGNCKP